MKGRISDRKFVACEKCPGRPDTVGSGNPRIVLYFTDRIEVKCRACGDTEVYWKEGYGPSKTTSPCISPQL